MQPLAESVDVMVWYSLGGSGIGVRGKEFCCCLGDKLSRHWCHWLRCDAVGYWEQSHKDRSGSLEAVAVQLEDGRFQNHQTAADWLDATYVKYLGSAVVDPMSNVPLTIAAKQALSSFSASISYWSLPPHPGPKPIAHEDLAQGNPTHLGPGMIVLVVIQQPKLPPPSLSYISYGHCKCPASAL